MLKIISVGAVLLPIILLLSAGEPLSASAADSAAKAKVFRPITTGALDSWLRPWEAPTADVTISTIGNVPIGSNPFSFTVTFDNMGADEGYGPFIDVYFPFTGEDGTFPFGPGDEADGVDFINATFSSVMAALPTPPVVQSFPADPGGTACSPLGLLTHPYAQDTTGAFVDVCGVPGDILVTFELPFGSFTPTQPPIVLNIDASLSNWADLNQPLTIYARGGYRFGEDELNNWCCDPSVVNPSSSDPTTWPDEDVIPSLITIDKAYNGPDDETATGPNYPRRYTITVDIADGQTVTDLDVTDVFDDNMAFSQIVSPPNSPPATTHVATPPFGVAAPPGNNQVVVNFQSVTGPTPAVVVVEFFIPLNDASGTPVIPAANGMPPGASDDRAGAVGDWTPLDPRDTGGTDNAVAGGVCPSCPILHTLDDKSIATQKDYLIVTDVAPGGTSPGDIYDVVIDFQISDFFAFEDIVIQDTISDGHQWTGATPTLTVNEFGSSTSGPMGNFNAGTDVSENFTTPYPPGCATHLGCPPEDGTTDFTFRVSDELIARGFGTNGGGQLLGACVDPTSSVVPPVCPTIPPIPPSIPTTGTLTFQVVVLDQFADDFPGDKSVDQGDVMDDVATISADVLNLTNFNPTTFVASDGATASIEIGRGNLSKEIFAVNGNTSFTSPVQVEPGDTITYRLRYTLPTSSFEQLVLTDYLPLPVFRVDDPSASGTPSVPPETAWSFDSVPVANPVPLPGVVQFGPAETLSGFYAYAPAPNPVSVAANSLEFNIGSFDDPSNPSTEIDLIFTVTVTNDPFADGLFLTNQAASSEDSTNAGDQVGEDIVIIELLEPVLLIKKSVVDTTNPNATISPPVAWPPPGTVSSNYLLANPIDSDIADVDAGDIQTFAIVIENVGRSSQGAFDLEITDTLQPGYIFPGGNPANLNLTVTRGDGAPIGHTNLGPSGTDTDLFNNGIELIDPGTGVGVCQAYDPVSGTNVIIITYELELDPSVNPAATIINTAEITNYAGEEGGEDHTGPQPNPQFQDQAITQVATVALDKDVTDTDQGFTPGLVDVAVGEVVEYTLEVTVPEGTSNNTTLDDTLPTGLAFVTQIGSPALISVTSSSLDLSFDTGGGPDTTFSNLIGTEVISNSGRQMDLNLGTVINANNDDTTAETITFVYEVVVLNTPGNVAATLLANDAEWNWDEGPVSIQAPNVRIVEADMNVVKLASPNMGDAGDTISFTITIDHNVTATSIGAYDLELTDVIPSDMTYVGGTLDCTTGTITPAPCTESGGTITAVWTGGDTNTPDFAVGDTTIITFDVTLNLSVAPGQVITNTADLTWTSLTIGDETTQGTAIPSDNTLSVERTGDITDVGTTANTYSTSGSDDVTIDQAVPGKMITATNQNHTDPGDSTLPSVGPVDVAIGEIVTYTTSIQIPEGTSIPLTFEDTLDLGLAIFSVDSLTPSSGDLSTDVGGGFPAVLSSAVISDLGPSPAGDGRVLSMDFGTVTNVNIDNTTAEVITLVYRAVVINGGSNDDGETRDNTAAWTIGTNTVSASTTVTILEPLLEVLKTGTPGTGDAGDTVQYSLTIQHDNPTSSTAAFDLSLTDAVPSGMTFAGGLDCTTGSVTPTTCTESAGTITATWTTAGFATTDTTIILYNVTVDNTVNPEDTLSNTATLTWTSLPGVVSSPQTPNNGLSVERTGDTGDIGGTDNDYLATDTFDFEITDPAISKSITATSVSSTTDSQISAGIVDLVVGETVTFEIEVTLPEGDIGQLTITDNLPVIPPDDGFLAVVTSGTEVTHIGANILLSSALAVGDPPTAINDTDSDTYDDEVVFDFGGSIENLPSSDGGAPNDDDRIRVRVVAIVVNDSANQNADELTNEALVDYSTSSQETDSIDVAIVEPVLNISKVANDITPFLGQTVTYTLTISHTTASNADAEEVVITDLLPTSPGLVNITVLPLPPGVVDTSIPPAMQFNIPSFILGSGPIIIQYTADLEAPPPFPASLSPGDTLDNTADLEWSSINDNEVISPEKRTGDSASNPANDYNDDDTEQLTVTNPDLTIDKDDGGITTTPGATYTYTLTIDNVGNIDATGVVITDVVPTYTTFVPFPGGSTNGWSCAPDNTAGSTCTISPDVGAGVGVVPATGGPWTIDFALTVDSTVPVLVDEINNTASITDDGTRGPEPTPSNNTNSDVTPLDALPIMEVDKDDFLDTVAPGTSLPFQIDFRNVGNQDASGVVLTDTVPPNTTLDLGASDPGWSCTGTPPHGPGDVCTLIPDISSGPGNMPAGSSGSVLFVLIVDDPFPIVVNQVTNTVDIEEDGTNHPSGTQSTDTESNSTNVVTLPNVDITKDVVATNQAFTAFPNVAIGEIVTYEVELTVPPGTIDNVTLTDILDLGLAFVQCNSIVSTSPALLVTDLAGGFGAACFNPPTNPALAAVPPNLDPENQARSIVFNLGNVSNNDTADQTLTINYDVVVLDNVDNVRGVNLNNSVVWEWDNSLPLAETAEDVTIVEPTLTIEKAAFPTIVSPGSPVTWTITIETDPSSDANAYDLLLTDVIPVGTTYIPLSLDCDLGTVLSSTCTIVGTDITATWTSFPLGSDAVIQFQTTMGNLGPGQGVRNEVFLEWTSLPGAPGQQSLWNILSTERTYDPPISAEASVRTPFLPDTGFAPGRVTELPDPPALDPYTALDGIWLTIPKLGTQASVVGIPVGGDGWDLTWLANNAGYLENTAFPTLEGNTAVTAHVYLPDGTPGPFVDLDSLQWGDQIHLYANGLRYTYEVRLRRIVKPYNTSVLGHRDLDWLTLITCGNYDETSDEYLDRVVIQAVLISITDA